MWYSLSLLNIFAKTRMVSANKKLFKAFSSVFTNKVSTINATLKLENYSLHKWPTHSQLVLEYFLYCPSRKKQKFGNFSSPLVCCDFQLIFENCDF